MAKGNDGQIKLADLNASLSGLVTGEATGDSPWTVTGNTGYKYRITAYGEVTLASTVDIVKDDQIVTGKTITLGTSEVGNTVALTAEPTPDVTVTSSSWASSNTSVATIDSSTGLVTIAGEGQTTITLTAVTSIGNITKTCTIKITKPLEIGDLISYTTSLNGVTLSNWKVFYVDGDYTYIILSDYLPNSAVSNDIKTNYHLTNGTGDYNIKSTTNRTDLINAMTNKDNWKGLLTGILNGNPIDYSSSTDTNIKAMGSPTLDLYVNSWNAKYPSNKIYTAQTENAMSDGYNGYYVGNSENPTTYGVSQSNTDTLYYPHNDQYKSCNGYRLASPSANTTEYVMFVYFNGAVSYSSYNILANFAFRPVVCLPSNILQ